MKGKIVIVSDMIPPGYGGAGIAAYNHAVNLNDNNELAFILTRTPTIPSDDFPQIKHFDLNKLKEIKVYRLAPKTPFLLKYKFGLARRFFPIIFNNLKLFNQLLFVLIKHRRDIRIIHCYSTTWLTFFTGLIAWIISKKVILEMSLVGHDDPTSVSMNDKLRIKYKLKRIQFKLADKIISKSLALSREYQTANLDSKKLTLIPYGIDTEQVTRVSEKIVAQLKRDLDIENRFPILLFIGSITLRKGIDIVFKTFPLFKEKYPNAQLLIIGNDSTKTDNPELHKIVESKKANKKSGVLIMPPVNNVRDYLSMADIFFFPSRREGLPIILLEALSIGVPIVANRISGITDFMMENGREGLLVDSENEFEYLSAIEKLTDNESLWKDISEAATNRAKSMFDIRIIEKQYKDLYHSMLG